MRKSSLDSIINAKRLQNGGNPLIDILRDLPDAVLMIDTDGNIFYANREAEKVFGFVVNFKKPPSAKSPPESPTKSERRSISSRQTSNFPFAATKLCGTTRKSKPSRLKAWKWLFGCHFRKIDFDLYPLRIAVMTDIQDGLKFRLSEGEAGAETREKQTPAKTDQLSENQTSSLLKRIPLIKEQTDDKTDFAKRAGSLPAPKKKSFHLLRGQKFCQIESL